MTDVPYRGFVAPDYLETLGSLTTRPLLELEHAAIRTLRAAREDRLFAKNVARLQATVEALADLQTDFVDLSGNIIQIGRPEELSQAEHARLLEGLRAFCPWKKGPFSFFGVEIDAEWRSDWKWNRILPHIRPLTDKRVADIGCHNGYFMFRMAAQNPACVVGFEPFAKHYWCFQLTQQRARLENLHFELLGVEHVQLYRRFFDTIFCLGILYHHTDPIGLLRGMREALAPGGELIIDCQGIPGDQPVALTPHRRYANARGIWFLPTQSCLEHWVQRAGYSEVECFFAAPLSTEEQRPTTWAQIKSLQDFLDPADPSRTIEGYPAPWRYYLRATR